MAQFMLTDARMSDSSGRTGTSGATGSGTTGSGTATSGTAGAGGSQSTMKDKFMLMGGNQAEMTKYVNSLVEIRGTLQPANRSGSGGGTGTGSSATGSGSGTGSGTGSSASGTSAQSGQAGMQSAQILRVTSVKQIAPSCSPENR